jgi:hypothetical protein
MLKPQLAWSISRLRTVIFAGIGDTLRLIGWDDIIKGRQIDETEFRYRSTISILIKSIRRGRRFFWGVLSLVRHIKSWIVSYNHFLSRTQGAVIPE